MKKTYYVSVPIDRANGQQTFAIDSESEKDAIARVQADGVMDEERCEYEVEGLDWENAEVTDEIDIVEAKPEDPRARHEATEDPES